MQKAVLTCWLGLPNASFLWQLLALLLSSLKEVRTVTFGVPDFVTFGSCVNVKVQKNLDLYKFSGTWFTAAQVPNEYMHTQNCIITDYSWNGRFMSVVHKGLNAEDMKVKQTSGMVFKNGTDPTAPILIVKVAGIPSNTPCEILMTDYENYACMYSCLGYLGMRAQFTWSLRRCPLAGPAEPDPCDAVFRDAGVDTQLMKDTRQGPNCPYWEQIGDLFRSIKYNCSYTQEEMKVSSKENVKGLLNQIVSQEKELKNLENDLLKESVDLHFAIKDAKALTQRNRQLLDNQNQTIQLIQDKLSSASVATVTPLTWMISGSIVLSLSYLCSIF